MYNNFEISLVVFMPNISTIHAITYTKNPRALDIFLHANQLKCTPATK